MKLYTKLAIILGLVFVLNNYVHPKPKNCTFRLRNNVWQRKTGMPASGISVGSPSKIWSIGSRKINAKGEMTNKRVPLAYYWENGKWYVKEFRFEERIPVKQIVANENHTVLLTEEGRIYRWQKDLGGIKRWYKESSTPANQIALGKYNNAPVIWYLDRAKKIFALVISSNYVPKKSFETDKEFIQIAASSDGEIWALCTDNYAYRLTDKNWVQAGTRKLKRIVVGNKDSVWGEGEQKIYKWGKYGSQRGGGIYGWREKTSTPSFNLENLAVGKDGSAWATVKTGSDVGTYKWENDTWIKINNQTYTSLSAYDADNAWGIIEVEK